jgi:hypothetical protein
MLRFAIASLMLAGSVAAMPAPARAQPVPYQFTPPPPIPRPPSSPAPLYPSMPGVEPPAPAPTQSHLRPYRVTPPPSLSAPRPGARPVQTAHGRTIFVPSSPAETFHDRASSCAQAGASAGLRAGQMNAFLGRCVN